MVDADYAAKKYEEGIKAFGGAEVYIRCGKEKDKGFLAVAECLHEAKEAKLTTDYMVRKYKAAARL